MMNNNNKISYTNKKRTPAHLVASKTIYKIYLHYTGLFSQSFSIKKIIFQLKYNSRFHLQSTKFAILGDIESNYLHNLFPLDISEAKSSLKHPLFCNFL